MKHVVTCSISIYVKMVILRYSEQISHKPVGVAMFIIYIYISYIRVLFCDVLDAVHVKNLKCIFIISK